MTCADLPQLTPDDRSASGALARHGVEVVPAVWTEPVPEGVEALVLRSTWDYHLRLAEFLAWIDAVSARGIPLWNPPRILRWNVDKRYLLEVEAHGVPVVPTRHAARGSGVTLSALLREAGWRDAVVKPSISGGAFQTWRSRGEATDDARFDRQLGAMDCLVQPFVPELVSGGEWSLLFFRGQYSHAVLKRPQSGDFRVQEEFGGVASRSPAPAEVVAAAERALAVVPEQLLYARVDGVVRNGGLELMELELVEPSLFLETAPGAAERFASAVSEVLGRASR